MGLSQSKNVNNVREDHENEEHWSSSSQYQGRDNDTVAAIVARDSQSNLGQSSSKSHISSSASLISSNSFDKKSTKQPSSQSHAPSQSKVGVSAATLSTSSFLIQKKELYHPSNGSSSTESSNFYGSLLGSTLLAEDPDNEDDNEYEFGATRMIEQEDQDDNVPSIGNRKMKQGAESPVIQYQQKYQHGTCYVLIIIGAGSKCKFGSGHHMIGVHIQSPKITTILSLMQMISKYIIYPKIDNIQNDIIFTISSNGERDGERIIVKNDESISEAQLFDVSLSWRLIHIWHIGDIHPTLPNTTIQLLEANEKQSPTIMQDKQYYGYHDERSTITIKTDSGLVLELLMYLDESICTLKKIIYDELGIHPRAQILSLLQQQQEQEAFDHHQYQQLPHHKKQQQYQ